MREARICPNCEYEITFASTIKCPRCGFETYRAFDETCQDKWSKTKQRAKLVERAQASTKSTQMEKRTARNWYWWLWLSPLITVSSLMLSILFIDGFYDPGRELICGGNWYNCDHIMATRMNTLIAVFSSALWHLILLIPALDKKSEFVRWHGRQTLLLAGLRTALPLALGLTFRFNCEPLGFVPVLEAMLGVIPILIAVWFFGTLWGQLQAARGDCGLMRWFGRGETLPSLEIAEKITQAAVSGESVLVGLRGPDLEPLGPADDKEAH